ncbi:amidohydrolase family protein [Novosphingobium bradum]|uniref:Amidohydrolase family protein n=1 Tax=Novosphingobium bradum TaxID=1737444 RepID=A0ABV7IPV2_9SPHN
MTNKPNFPVYDADHHLYEPREAFERYLPERYKRDFYFVEKDGRTKLVINGMLSEYIPVPTFDVVAAPGAWEPWFRSENPEGKTRKEMQGKAIRPPQTWRSGEGRIAMLDEQGLQGALVFPTLASVIEERIGARGDVSAALFHSLNQWTADEWGFAREDRLFSVPFISLTDVDKAVEELEFVLKAGARCVNIRPAPVPDIRGSRSFGFEEYDPFWARVADAGIFVTMHGSDSGYDKVTNWWKGSQSEFKPFERDTFGAAIDLIGMATTHSMLALICHGVFDRHPTLKVVSVENGSDWIGPMLSRLDGAYGKMPSAFKTHPRDQFQKHVWVAPFYEDDVNELKELIPVERTLFGSDYPHPEGVAQPLQYLEDFKDYTPDELEKVFSSNLKGLLEGAAI